MYRFGQPAGLVFSTGLMAGLRASAFDLELSWMNAGDVEYVDFLVAVAAKIIGLLWILSTCMIASIPRVYL